MTLTYRSTVGRRLTVTEGDGNVAQLASGAGMTQVFSGDVSTFEVKVNGSTMFTANTFGVGVGTVSSSNSDDFLHIQRDVDTATGINIRNDHVGASTEGYIHLWGGPVSGVSTGSGLRMSANSLAGGALVDLVAHDNEAFSIIQQSNKNLDFYANNLKAFQIKPTNSTVNFATVKGGAVSSSVVHSVDGTDTNISIAYDTKNAGSHLFRTRDGTDLQVAIQHTASTTAYIVLTGSNGGNPSIDLNTSNSALKIGGTASTVQWGTAAVNLGASSNAALGTIGGNGPVGSTQFAWLKFLDSTGSTCFVPIWR